MSADSLPELLQAVKDELREMRRPRMLFDIGPSPKHSFNVYYITLKNVGGSPAYDISCTFDPDLPYSNATLSQLKVFRNLSHLAQNEQISFYFGSAIRFLNDPDFKKSTTVTINYQDADKKWYVDKMEVSLVTYKNILFIDEKDMGMS